MDWIKRQWRREERRRPGLYMNPDLVSGEYEVSVVDAAGRVTPVLRKKNLLLYTWGWIAARCIGLGDETYKVSAAYVEYERSATAGAVAVPSYVRSDGAAYYNALSGDKDYLRVALAGTPTLDVSSGYSALLPGGAVNRVSFPVAAVEGATGVRGTAFTNAGQAVVYGLALVAAPLLSDPAQDVILSRGYFDPGDQILVPAAGQVQVTWRVAFK